MLQILRGLTGPVTLCDECDVYSKMRQLNIRVDRSSKVRQKKDEKPRIYFSPA